MRSRAPGIQGRSGVSSFQMWTWVSTMNTEGLPFFVAERKLEFLDDVLGNRHRGRRRWRWRVADRGDRSGLADPEVVDEPAVGIDGLGAHPGGCARHVGHGD